MTFCNKVRVTVCPTHFLYLLRWELHKGSSHTVQLDESQGKDSNTVSELTLCPVLINTTDYCNNFTLQTSIWAHTPLHQNQFLNRYSSAEKGIFDTYTRKHSLLHGHLINLLTEHITWMRGFPFCCYVNSSRVRAMKDNYFLNKLLCRCTCGSYMSQQTPVTIKCRGKKSNATAIKATMIVEVSTLVKVRCSRNRSRRPRVGVEV